MKFNIKNLFTKKSLKKLEKATLVGVASLALIIPLGMSNGNTANAMSRRRKDFYENCLEDSGYAMTTPTDGVNIIWQHPSIRNTYASKQFLEDAYYHWMGPVYDVYAKHFKQIYTPYLWKAMPKHVTSSESYHWRHDNYLIHKDEEQLGLLKHSHKARRHARRHIRKHANKRHARRHEHRSHRNYRR